MNFLMPPRKTTLYLTNKLLLHQRQITPQIVNTTGMISRQKKNSLNKDMGKDSWAQGTKRQYKTYIEQWNKFCMQHSTTLQSASVAEGAEFLLLLYKKGLRYLAIHTTRMLSAILRKTDNIEFAKHPIVTRVFKGIFRNRSSISGSLLSMSSMFQTCVETFACDRAQYSKDWLLTTFS